MALIVQDRVKVNSTTTGTGTIVLANTAPTGYQSFAVIGNANTTYYTIAGQTTNEWEVGIGTYFLANSSLSRTTILASSNANAAVTFSAGTKDVFVTYPAEKAIYLDSSNNAAPSFGTFSGAVETLTGTGQNLVTYSQDYTNAAWTKAAVTATASGATAPDSTSTAITILETVATGTHNFALTTALTTSSGALYTISVYVKANGRNYCAIYEGGSSAKGKFFNITAGGGGSVLGNLIGAPVSATLTYVGNDWYRASIVVTAGGTIVPSVYLSTDGTTFSYAGNASLGIYAWGMQVEFGSTLNTYIPTTTTAVYGTPTLSLSGVANVTLDSTGTMNLSSAGTGSVNLNTNGGANTSLNVLSLASSDSPWILTAGRVGVQGGRFSSLSPAIQSTDTGPVDLRTNAGTTGGTGAVQLRASHTASAVNYVQATGAATGANVTISAQGSDANVGVNITGKAFGAVNLQANNSTGLQIYNASGAAGGAFWRIGTNYSASSPILISSGTGGTFSTGGAGGMSFYTNTVGSQQFNISHTASAVNYPQVTGGATGTGVTVSAQGSDANVDVKVTPKGTGYANITSGGIKFPDATVQTTAATPGLTAAGNNSIAVFNTNITANATIATGTNGLSVGPVNTANGVVVTVGANATWITL
jgi:phosphotransferase system HPr-like phosphotransfer protein